jgi:sortase A
MAFWQIIERLLMVLGLLLLAGYFMLRIYGAAGALLGRMQFEAARSTPASQVNPAKKGSLIATDGIDFSLWSEKRIKAFQETLARHFEPPLALLEIPRIHLEVPVFNGTSDSILNRGVGRIIGTARVGGRGNLGIAGHRDGFFRGLKDLKEGDPIQLIAPDRTLVYQVDNIVIVSPDDVHILENRAVPTITLVTCYPFYFVGDAPQRYVLQCSLKKSGPVRGGDQPKRVGLTSTIQ